jgi:hypothetical protein
LPVKARNTNERHIIATPQELSNFVRRKINKLAVNRGDLEASFDVMLHCTHHRLSTPFPISGMNDEVVSASG